jgi:tripartite-type tricarboxylate transporter receptor subunit TctC
MKTTKCLRRSVLNTALSIACLAAATSSSAQEWPSRNITVVVPLGAGTASDVTARVVMDQVGKQVGQTFIIENRPGAGGTIGANAVAKAAPDGYTILAYGALAVSYALYSKLPYDALNDFVPIISLGQW